MVVANPPQQDGDGFMSNRQPNFRVGDEVNYQGRKCTIKTIKIDGPSKFSYTVRFPNGHTEDVKEGRLKSA